MKQFMNKKMVFGTVFFCLALSLFGQNLDDFDLRSNVLYKYKGQAKEVRIPDNLGITEIANNAFRGNSTITSVTISAGVSRIEYGAFAGCNKLTEIVVDERNVAYSSYAGILFDKSRTALIQYPAGKLGQSYTIPNEVKQIADYAFYGCGSLTGITIPAGVVYIGSNVFERCGKLTEINVTGRNTAYSSIDGVLFDKARTLLIQYPAAKRGQTYSIPNTVKQIENSAFAISNELVIVNIPVSVTAIKNSAFTGCSKLTSVNLQSGLISIGDGAFSNCGSLTGIIIPAKVNFIGKNVFDGCLKLTEITVDEGNTVYSSSVGTLFNKEKTILIKYPAGKQEQAFNIPNGVKQIESKAFFRCGNLTTVIIHPGVISIGNMAFSRCVRLTQITIPETVTSIGYSAFDSCESLISITIPAGVTSLGNNVFDNCISLTTITVDEKSTAYSSNRGVLFNKMQTTLIKYPEGKLEQTYTIPNFVRHIESYAFSNCKLVFITVPATVTTIGDNAFFSCRNLETFILSKESTLSRSAFPAHVQVIPEEK